MEALAEAAWLPEVATGLPELLLVAVEVVASAPEVLEVAPAPGLALGTAAAEMRARGWVLAGHLAETWPALPQ